MRYTQFRNEQPCAFCDSLADSREHYLPQWMDKVLGAGLESNFHNKYNLNYFSPGESGPVWGPVEKRRRRNGNLRSNNKKIVCKSCNNNWMSQLQDAAKPFLTNLISMSEQTLRTQDRLAIAAWATMTAMVYEFDDPAQMAIPREHRKWFKSLQIPPPNGWMIWAGRHSGESWNLRLKHRSGSIRGAAQDPKEFRPHCIQSTIISIKHLHILVMSSTSDYFIQTTPVDIFAKKFSEKFGLIQLWPETLGTTVWSEIPIKNEREMDEMEGYIEMTRIAKLECPAIAIIGALNV